jgi:hypothetical protein
MDLTTKAMLDHVRRTLKLGLTLDGDMVAALRKMMPMDADSGRQARNRRKAAMRKNR